MALDLNVVVAALLWLLQGAQLTLSSSLLAIVLGVMVGIALTLALHAGIRPLQALVWLYISFAAGRRCSSRS
jgi:ABC-type amino acid transport system permease subunit